MELLVYFAVFLSIAGLTLGWMSTPRLAAVLKVLDKWIIFSIVDWWISNCLAILNLPRLASSNVCLLKIIPDVSKQIAKTSCSYLTS